MKKLSFLPIALVAFSILFASCAPKSAVSNKSKQKGVLLRLTPSEGSAYSIQTKATQNIITHVASRDIKVHMNIEQTLKLKVAKRYDQDSLLIHASFQHIAAKTSAMGRQTSFDSDNSQGSNNSKFSDLFNKIKNSSFTIKITPLGKVLNIKGLNHIQEAVKNSSSITNPAIKGIFKNLLNKQKLKDSFFSIGVYPKQPITEESQWRNEQTITGKVPMTVHLTYTVQSIQPDKILLNVKGSFSSAKDSTTIRGMKIPVSVSGTQTGNYTINRSTGLISSGSVSQNISTTMSMLGRSIKVEVTGKTKISTTKLDQ